jgi:hypothetical protein
VNSTDNQAEQNAISWLKTIRETVAKMEAAQEASDDDQTENIREQIEEEPLSIQVRGGWYTPGAEKPDADEYEILLSTGGPALRIVGDLSEHMEPSNARLEYQDWGTPWTEYHEEGCEEVLLSYAQVFYFGG